MKRSSKKQLPETPFVLPGHRVERWGRFSSSHAVSKVGQATIVRDVPGKSISFFELAENIAAEAKKRGRPIEPRTQKWIDVPEWTPERERNEIHNFLRPDEDPFAARRLGCRALLCGSQSAAGALSSMAQECLGQLQEVADSVLESELYSAHASIAAEQLARVLTEACAKLNELARKRPKIFHPFTRKHFWKWPVMKSTYQEFGDDETALLAGLQLGKDLPLRLDPKAQWGRHIEDDAGRYAWALLWYVWGARSENNVWGFNYGCFGKLANALPPLDKTTATRWWAVAKAALLHTYPKLLDVPELASLVEGRKERRFPSRLEGAILDKLRTRFLSLARLPRTSPT